MKVKASATRKVGRAMKVSIRRPTSLAPGKGTKATGLGWTTLTVSDSTGTTQIDIRNDCTDLAFATPRGIQDTTGIDKSAHERLLLLADFSITPKGVFNAAVSHAVFATVPSTSVVRPTIITVNTKNLQANCLYSDYQLTRNPTGELLWQAPGALADGAVPTWS